MHCMQYGIWYLESETEPLPPPPPPPPPKKKKKKKPHINNVFTYLGELCVHFLYWTFQLSVGQGTEVGVNKRLTYSGISASDIAYVSLSGYDYQIINWRITAVAREGMLIMTSSARVTTTIRCQIREQNGIYMYPDSKVHGAKMGPIWGRHDPGGPMLTPWTLLSELLSPALIDNHQQYKQQLQESIIIICIFITISRIACPQIVSSYIIIINTIIGIDTVGNTFVDTLFKSIRNLFAM